jgi:hypothetical protein
MPHRPANRALPPASPRRNDTPAARAESYDSKKGYCAKQTFLSRAERLFRQGLSAN